MPKGESSAPTTAVPCCNSTTWSSFLRNAFSDQPGRFGCSITPRQENLAAVQDFLRESAQRSLKPSERDRWLTTLRQRLGRQDIQVHGIDPRSRAARTIVEADYHMKLIGMGIAEGTLGVTSYLDSVQLGADGAPPAMDVLRWWFTLDYESLLATPQRNAFELRGPGVKVLSENELLAERGRRCIPARPMRRTCSSRGASPATSPNWR